MSDITYSADNNPTGWLWSDGKARTIGYDDLGMIASYTLGDPNTTGTICTVTRDSAGRITGYVHNGQSQLDQASTYDALDRLARQSVNGASIGYTYDPNGNRTSKSIGGNTYANTIAATALAWARGQLLACQ